MCGPGCLKGCIGLLVGRARPSSSEGKVWPALQDCFFLASCFCTLVGEVGLEACAGFLVGGAGACPLVGGAGSWPSGVLGHV